MVTVLALADQGGKKSIPAPAWVVIPIIVIAISIALWQVYTRRKGSK